MNRIFLFVLIAIIGAGIEYSIARVPNQKPAEKHYVIVWDGDCIRSIQKGPKTRIEAPLAKDGHPILDQAVLYGAVADWNLGCGHYEPRD